MMPKKKKNQNKIKKNPKKQRNNQTPKKQKRDFAKKRKSPCNHFFQLKVYHAKKKLNNPMKSSFGNKVSSQKSALSYERGGEG